MKHFFKIFLFTSVLLLGAYESKALILTVATSEQTPSCQGATDGWVTIDSLVTLPPTGPYLIRINTSPVQFFNVGDTIFNLTTQNYIITVQDLGDNSAAFAPVNFASSGINAAAFSSPASCFGVCDGNANLAVIGGVAPYTFQWDDPSNQTTQVATGLCAGLYRVTVSDQNGCTQVDSTTVNEPPQLFPNVSVTDVSCAGFSDGVAVSNPSGGSGVFVNYEWSTSPLNNTNTESGLSPGTYSITVTDDDGCTGTSNFTVGQPAPLGVSFSVIDNPCFNGNTGSITTNVSGGTTPYTFNWDGGISTQNRNNLSAGTYRLTITDDNNCTLIDSATVGEGSEILINFTVNSNNDCFGDANGSVTANYSGGSSPYNYLWSQSSNGSGAVTTINNLVAGTYTITVTDNLGCTAADSVIITEQPPIVISVDNFADPACNGDANGFIDLDVSGGTPPLSFSWSPSGISEDLFGIGAGNYTLTVTDANSCTAIFDTTLVDPPVLSFIFDSLRNVSCNGVNDGFLRVLASGGTGAYSYNWSNSETTAANDNLLAGTYRVTVSDVNGCSAIDSATVTEPPALNVTASSTDASCFGDSDGSAQSTPSGGTPPYTFSWNPGGQSTQNISNIPAGTYTITVTDQNGCTANTTTIVNEPLAITINITGSDLNCNGDNSGVALANVLGGNPGYSFQWNDPANQTTNPASSLAAGTYRVTVTDVTGCTAIDSVTLTEPPPLSVSLNTYDVSCGGVSDGAAAATVNGGTPPYTYSWGPGNPTGQGTDSISGLIPNNYSLTVTDNNGCNTSVNFTINQLPPVFSLSDSSSDPLCNGEASGFIAIQISGGAAPFNYNWNPPLPNQGSQPNLAAGTYNVTVTDNNGCSNTTSVSLGQPSAITVSDAIVDESCAPGGDGSISLTVNGGTPAYNYTWSPPLTNSPTQNNLAAGTYDLTITDANGCTLIQSYTVNTLTASFTVSLVPNDASCNGLSDGSILANALPAGGNYTYTWSDIGPGASLRPSLSAGTYRVTVTDTITGCFVVDSATVNQPSAILSNLTLNPTGCAGPGSGSVTSTPSGGDGGPYSFSWNTPGGNVSGNTVTNLTAGSYDVTISDASSCTLIDTFQIVSNPSNIDPNEVIGNASCNGLCDGTIDLNPSSGIAPYTYLWNDFVTTQNRNSLCAGTYTVTITGADNCDTSITLNVTEPLAINASVNTTEDTCVAGVGGARVSSINNGTPPYTYNWPAAGVAVGDSVNSLSTGTYDLTISDANGCQVIVPFSIGNFATFSVSLDSTDANCSGGNDGAITSTLTGGTAPFNYSWTGGLVGANPINVAAGTYTVTVTDGNGCGAIESIVVNQPVPLQLNSLLTYDESCNPGNDGAARVFFGGGTGPYTYNWPASGVSVGDSVNSLTAGSYSVTITDSNSCDTIVNFNIGSNPTYTVSVNASDVSCNGFNDGSITLNLSGAIAPITYNWSDIGNGPGSRNSLAPNTYDVTITDGSGCTALETISLSEPNTLAVNGSATDESCTPGNDGSTSTAASGGTAPYSYSWTPGGATTPGLTGLAAGSYTVTVTDLNGCTASETINVAGGGNILIGATVVEPDCFGDCNGNITLSPSGGVPPYSYLWDDNSSNFFRTLLCAGSYTVTVTDNSSCERIETILVGQPDSLEANLSSTPESCTPGSDGTATSATLGGTPPYTYSWSPGGGSTASINSLTAGTYRLTITDANSCTVVDSVTVNGGGNIAFNETIVDASCNGDCDGSITLSPSGGTAPYTYLWDDNSTNFFRAGLCAGSYLVTVTDNASCSRSVSFTVGEPGAILANVTSTDESCSPGNDGTASTSASGGTPPYSYNWAPGGATTSGIVGLSPGTYLVTITDINGCTAVDSATINSGSNIALNEVLNDASCNGVCDGSITLAPSGGTAPYTYLWDDNTTFSNKTGLCAGSYQVTVTDNLGCTRIQGFVINEPSPLLANISATDETCTPGNDGTASTAATGGTAPYSYLWSPGGATTPNLSNLSSGTYFVTVTDLNGCTVLDSATVNDGGNIVLNETVVDLECNGVCIGSITLSPSGGTAPYAYLWGDNSTNFFRTSLCAGSYAVTVTDATNCTATRTIDVIQPDPIQANANATNESCNPGGDGSISTSTTGGTAPYTYSWNPGGATTPGLSALSAGTYTVTITDGNNCTQVETVTVGLDPSFTISAVLNDPSCPGAADGSIDQTITGSFSNLQYAWDNSLPPTEDQNNLSPGTYNVTVTDLANSCTDNESYVINPSTSNILPNLVTQDDGCGPLNICQGYAKSDPVGGTPPYTFTWTGPSTNVSGVDSIGTLCAGNYTLNIIDANGCDTTINFTINPASIISPNLTVQDESCDGLCDGTAKVNPTGGAAPYTFNWSVPSGNVDSIGGLCAGNYSVTITDALLCDTVISFNINTTSINYTLSSTDQSCNGGCDGTAEVTIPTGTSNFAFNWSPAPGNGQGTSQVGGLCVGEYFVTITDNGSGCTAVDSVTIDPFSPILPNEASVDESCAGACDGVARVNPSGGNPPYSYTWTPVPPNNQQGNAEIRDLCAGNYSVLIEDVNGCDTTINFTITAASAIVGNIVGEDQNCGNTSPCEGKAYVTPSGGTSPYTYTWSLGVQTGLSSDTAINLCNGQYFVTITDDNGCTSLDSVTISSPSPIDSSFSAVNSTCNNCDGSLKISPSGGTAPYTYLWTDASSNQLGTTDSIGDLCAGIYFVEVTDNSGCSASFARSISDIGAELISVNKSDASCFGGSDGQASVNFVCSDPACSIAWLDASAQPLSITTATASNLSAGNYFVQVTNNTGCISIEPFTIDQPTQILASISSTDASCNSSCDGTASVTVSGGTAPYQFNWSPAPGSGQGTANIGGLCAATYSVRITDANGCDTTLSVVVGSPAALSATFTTVDANCNQSDGSITATVSGGTVSLDYQYQWFDASNNPLIGQNTATANNLAAGIYVLQVTDDNNCTASFNVVLNSTNGPTITVDSLTNISCRGGNDGAIFTSVSGFNPVYTFNWLNQGQTTDDINNLTAGTYTVVVTNAIGCVSSDTVVLTEPTALVPSINTTDANCGQCNGSATISMSGGNAPFTYLWSNGSTADTAANLCAGVHTVDVTDANGCSESFTFTINTVEGPSDATISATNESCFGAADGSVTVNPIGGTPPYTYLWLHNGATSNSLSNLSSGTYFILITDAAGCSRNEEVVINSPNELEIVPTVVSSTCRTSPCNGSIRLNVSGGNQPYTYNWQFAPSADTNFLGGLCAGIYEVTVSDANGCAQTLFVNLSNSGNLVVANPTVSDVSCNGSCDGSLISNLTPSASVTYRWLNTNGVAIAPTDTDLLNAACADEYVLEVTSLPEGCIRYITVRVSEPDTILLGSSIVSNISCNGACDGEIFVSTTGGNILYTYSWDDPNGQEGIPATDLCAGNYSVTATDANGCSATTSVTLTDPPPLDLTINAQSVLDCSEDCDASADVTANGGNPPYTFSWAGGQSGSSPNDLCFGANLLTVTDATGCSEQITVNIEAIDTVVAQVPSDTLFCEGDSIRLLGTVNGSTVNASAWYLSDTTTLLSSSADTTIFRNVGSYTFFFIASNGSCNDTTIYQPSVVANPILQLPERINIYKDETATIRISGKEASYLYNWTPADGLNDTSIAEPNTSIQESRTYVLTVTDTNGCNYLDSVEVVYNDDLDIPSGFTPNGDGKNDVWEIEVLEEFPEAKVQIFNRWGELLFEQDNGYQEPWDGTYQGEALPIGTYYYIIDLKSDRFEALTGPITILK